MVWISSKRAREDGTGRWGRKALFGPGSSAAHPLSPAQCPPARTCKEALGREGAWGAYEFCFPHQGDGSLPRASLALPELPGVTFILVCRKHVFHGWLHWIIITRHSFDQNNVISIVRSIPPPPHSSLPSTDTHSPSKPQAPAIHIGHTPPRHKNLMMCDTMSGKRERWDGLAKWMDVPLAFTALPTLCQCLSAARTHAQRHTHTKTGIKSRPVLGTWLEVYERVHVCPSCGHSPIGNSNLHGMKQRSSCHCCDALKKKAAEPSGCNTEFSRQGTRNLQGGGGWEKESGCADGGEWREMAENREENEEYKAPLR